MSKIYENGHKNVLRIWTFLSHKVQSKLQLSKYVKNKSCSPNFIFFNEKKYQKDSTDFWHKKNDFENQNCAIVDLPFQIDPNTYNIFMAVL